MVTSTELSAPALLDLIWLASPALPVGGFSYSEGLETAVDAGWLRTEAEVREWLLDQLMLSLARSDLPLLIQAIEAWRRGDRARIEALNAWVLSTRETAEFRRQTEQMGRSMLEWLRHAPAAPAHAARGTFDPAAALDWLAELSPAPAWPIAFACAAARTEAPASTGALSFAFGWAENMVQSAIKAVPLGQVAGQRVLQALAAAIPAAVQHALALPEADRQAFTPMLALASARHETQYSRLFRS